MTVDNTTTLGEVERILAHRAERIRELEDNETEMADRICEWFNPPDDYSTELDAIERAHDFIVEQPCTCKFTGPDEERHEDANGACLVPWDDGDQCKRCGVLGRYFDKSLGR